MSSYYVPHNESYSTTPRTRKENFLDVLNKFSVDMSIKTNAVVRGRYFLITTPTSTFHEFVEILNDPQCKYAIWGLLLKGKSISLTNALKIDKTLNEKIFIKVDNEVSPSSIEIEFTDEKPPTEYQINKLKE